MNELINCREAAKVAKVSTRTILRAIQARQLDAVKIGEGKTCSYMISRSAVAEYIHRRGRK
ncbi:excisionase family DNA-binding protein [Brevibacillus reuszeri]|uniref:excisionase family DNA-binding protein n=1 Tax=Brevibacillus reuszeri TaxID=54915 RepID=UPI000CCC2113